MNSVDFNTAPSRRGSGSYKWDSDPDPEVIPLWVADMDFEVATPIREALARRVDHGVFGYTLVPQSYYSSVNNWYRNRYGINIDGIQPICTSGVVPAVSAAIKALTHPGDGVAILTPVYNCFFSSIRNNGCIATDIPLIRTDCGRHFSYDIDFDLLRERLDNPRVPLLLFCNPHNPACRAWTREELLQVAEICRSTGTILLSDEIHGDLTMPGFSFTSIAALGEEILHHAVIFSSPSKAFNIAGLQIANILTASQRLRYLIDRAINDNEVCDVNPFGIVALQAAYNESAPWLDALIPYIHGNFMALDAEIERRAPYIRTATLEATYLAWLDISPLGIDDNELEEYLKTDYHVWVNAGSMYGNHGYIRINLATPRSRLMEGIDRLLNGIDSLIATVK